MLCRPPMNSTQDRALSASIFIPGLWFVAPSTALAQHLEVHVVNVDQGLCLFVLIAGNGLEIDRANYLAGAPWPSTTGRALNLKSGVLDGTANDDPLNCCTASTPIGGANTDRGTPNLANTNCP